MPASSRRLRLLALTLATLLSTPAGSVIILDETWEAGGGSPEEPSAGFDQAVALAAEPQFSAVIGLGGEDRSDGYACTGTWLGNDADGHAFVLTAAHCYDGVEPDEDADLTFRTDAGTSRREVARTLHPFYNSTDDKTGYDMAVVELDGPIEDAGPPPVLYAGQDEAGAVGTMVGYGTRGTGSSGEDERFDAGIDKAAARNVVDAVDDVTHDGSAGNSFAVDFDSPDGESSSLGDAQPTDAMEGILGSGDSGGSLWMETEAGWRIIGVNASGGETYGEYSYFSRISTQLPFILTVFPGATYAP